MNNTNLSPEKFQEVFWSDDPNLKLKLGFLGHRYLFEGEALHNEEMMQLCIDSAQELKQVYKPKNKSPKMEAVK